MGYGKTSAAINFMNASSGRFIYITPFLSEVERIYTACSDKRFVSPEARATKLCDVKRLIEAGRNIVSTHALFNMFDDETAELIRRGGYTLVMDEVADVVHQIQISDEDLCTLLEKYVSVEGDGKISWVADEYKGLFEPYKKALKNKQLIHYSDKSAVWLFPIEVFRAFQDVYVLTYMFESQLQRCYFDYYGMEYDKHGVSGDVNLGFRFSEHPTERDGTEYDTLIRIVDDDRLCDIGEAASALSKTWYVNADDEALAELKKNTQTFFRKRVGCRSSDCLWTTFQDFKSRLTGDGYTKGFLACNARATNQYRQRSTAAYLINRYINPVVKNFFATHGIVTDDEGYALSEMIQWIWRSAIRDGKQINIYIPSRRMRNLLYGWLGRAVKGDDNWKKISL